MEFEFDRDGSTAEGEKYYVYAFGKGKKRCIGRVIRSERTGHWSAYLDGELLATAAVAEDAAQKLLAYAAVRCPAMWGKAAEPQTQSVETRFARLRRRIPRRTDAAEAMVRSARHVPIERRGRLLEDVAELIGDLEAQLLLWRKVRNELVAVPRLQRWK